MRLIDTAERRARLATRHFLAAPASSVDQVAGSMVGLHSSDPVTVYLSLQARVDGFTHQQLEQSLYEERSLLRLLGMRRTMFVVPHDLGAIMEAGCTRLLAPAERRRLVKMVTEQGLTADGEAWVEAVSDATVAALERRGEALAAELREDVPELALKLRFGDGTKWAGPVGVSTRILFLLATEARIIRGRPRGTWISSQYRWAPIESWIASPLPELDKDEAQAELLRRWLAQFGPGTFTDLKWWTGWTVRDTKAALAGIEAVEVDLEDGTGWVLPDDAEPPPEEGPSASLLPGLDPTPMGWKDREWFVGGHSAELFDHNGNIGPTVWASGRIVGAWGQTADGAVVCALLERVSPEESHMIEERRAALEVWLDGKAVMPRFPAPLQKRIAAGSANGGPVG